MRMRPSVLSIISRQHSETALQQPTAKCKRKSAAMRETDATGRATIIACSVQKAAVVENSSLIMGLGGGGGGGAADGRQGRRRRQRLRKDYISFVSALGRRSVGPPKRREGERPNYQRRTKTSRGKREDWRRIQILPTPTVDWRLACLTGWREAWWKGEGGRQTGRRHRQGVRPNLQRDRLWGCEMSAIPTNYKCDKLMSQGCRL